MTNILVSFDFPPMIGGAHMWLYEIYRRWPTDVHVLTAEYSRDESVLRQQRLFDSQSHGAITISRQAHTAPPINVLSPSYLASLWGQVSQIKTLAVKHKDTETPRTLIHALRAFPEGIAAWLYRRMNPKSARLITFVHGEEVLVSQTSRQLRMLANRVYRDSDLVIANSESTRRILSDAYPGVNGVCVHPGVNAAAFNSTELERANYRREFGWSDHTVIVLTLARMEPRKNHAMVIRAIGMLRGEGVPIALICAGDGPERANLERLVESLGMSEWIRFVGIVPESMKSKLYAAADIFAMPSITVGEMIEGFGIVFLEAAAAGLPTVCGNTGGQREAILEGKSGYAVDGASVKEVAGALGRLAADRDLRRQFGQAGRAWAADHDWHILGTKLQARMRYLHSTNVP